MFFTYPHFPLSLYYRRKIVKVVDGVQIIKWLEEGEAQKVKMTVEVLAIEQDNFGTASVDMKYSDSPARTHKVVQMSIT